MSSTSSKDRSRVIAIGLAALLLIAGAIAGISIDRLWARGNSDLPGVDHERSHSAGQVVERLGAQLNLRDDQLAAIKSIVDEVISEAKAVHEQLRPRMRAAHERAQAAILEILDEQQAAKYRRMIETYGRHDQDVHAPGEDGHQRMRHP